MGVVPDIQGGYPVTFFDDKSGLCQFFARWWVENRSHRDPRLVRDYKAVMDDFLREHCEHCGMMAELIGTPDKLLQAYALNALKRADAPAFAPDHEAA